MTRLVSALPRRGPASSYGASPWRTYEFDAYTDEGDTDAYETVSVMKTVIVMLVRDA